MTGNVLASLYGWVNSSWQKNPLLFGYSSGLQTLISDESLDEGTNVVAGGEVPAGEIWVITNLSFLFVGTSPDYIQIRKNDLVINAPLWGITSPTSGVLYDRQGWWVWMLVIA